MNTDNADASDNSKDMSESKFEKVVKETFGVKVSKNCGEGVRRYLINSGHYLSNTKPTFIDGSLIFPIKSKESLSDLDLEELSKLSKDCGGYEIIETQFESHVKAREPARHELIGGIAVMQDDDVEEAEYLLKSRPSIHTVLHSESAVSGEYRIKEFKVLAGEKTTRTHYIEYSKRFVIDLAAAYFSARLSNERQRILSSMKGGERVLDMFAGVAPFPVVLSDKASIIYACDINPDAVRLMRENISLNHCKNVIPVLADALDLDGILPKHSFDCIIMNLPMTSVSFLKTAFSLCREGGIIHCYTLQSKEGEMTDMIRGFTKGKITEKVVRSYSPTQHHAVYDIVYEML